MRAARTGLSLLPAPLLAAALAAACWGDVVPVWPDGQPDSDSGTDEAPQPIPGGGLGDAPLDGRLDLFLLREDTGEPVPGARVLLETAGGDAHTAQTDEDGHATFVDEGLVGRVDLHVLAGGFVTESFLEVGKALATLPLRPVVAASPAEPATISGTVSGWEGLPEPTATRHRAVLVAFGPRWADLISIRQPLPVEPVPAIVVEIDGEDPSFELEVPPVPGALYVFAGLVGTFGTPDTADDVGDWSMFTAHVGIEPGAGGSISGLALELDAGLPISFHATLGSFPGVYERAGVEMALDLGDQGTIWVPGTRQGGKWFFPVPEQAGALAAGSPLVIARGDQSTTSEEGAGDVEATPLGRYIARDLGSLPGYTRVAPFVVPGMPSPPAQVGFDGQRFQCLPMMGTDLARVVLSGAATGAEHWRITAFGNLPGSIVPPSFPADWGFGGIPAGAVVVRAWTVAFTADPAELHFASYPQLVREVAFEAVEANPVP